MTADTILANAMFWGHLARATGASMAASSDKDLRRQWVDDLIPEGCKPSNGGLWTEGVAHLLGNPNGKFGKYRFLALLPWALVRNPDREPAIEEIELDHGRKELRLIVSVVPEKGPNQQAPEPASGLAPGRGSP